MKKLILCVCIALIALTMSAQNSLLSALELHGELDIYSSIAADGGTFPRNAAHLNLSALQGLGMGEAALELEIRASSVDSSDTAFAIKELYYRKYFEFDGKIVNELSLLAGYTRFTWGKSDGLRVIDVINPQYLNFAVFDDVEARKLGRLTLTAQLSLGQRSRFSAIFLPKPEESILENYALYPAQMQTLYDMEAADTLEILRPEFSGRVQDSSAGFRFESHLAGFDFDLYFYHGFFNQPFFIWGINTELNPYVSQEYRKITMWGFDFERPIASYVLRGEIGVFTDGMMVSLNEAALTADLFAGGQGVRDKTKIDFVLGLDTLNFIIKRLYMNIQYGASILANHEDILIRDQTEHVFTLKLEYTFAGDKVKLGAAAMLMPGRGFLFNPELVWHWDQSAELKLGCYILSSEEDDYMFGNYGAMDFIYARFGVKF